MRHLYDFWLQSRQPAYRAFILSNARSIWDHNQNADHEFGLRWTGPFRSGRCGPAEFGPRRLNAAVALAPGPLGADHQVGAVKAPAGLGAGPGGMAEGTNVVEIGPVRATAVGARPR